MFRISLLGFILFISTFCFSQENYIPSKDNIEARKWFQDSKFGLFIHWGIYSVLGDGEWVMNKQNISIDEYNKLASFFNPAYFDADEWVLIAKNAGMKYITITTRHHDGFSMFNSKASDFNIVKKSPYGRDIIKMLTDACNRHGLKIFFYYSQLDWYRDDYFPRGKTGLEIEGRNEGDWNDYVDFMKAQLTELLTNYGEIAGFWFDGEWDQFEFTINESGKREFLKKNMDFKLNEIYSLIHKLQPQALIGSNHHLAPNPGEDFQMFEKDLPGRDTKSFATKADDIGKLPLEVCETINGTWGFNLKDNKHKSKKKIVQYLVKAAGYNSNLLLNVGPMPNGRIQQEHIDVLKEVGEWLEIYGKTIYKTRGGPVKTTDEIASTQLGNTVFLHFLNNKKKSYFLENYSPKIKSLKYFNSGKNVNFELINNGLQLTLEESEIDNINTLLVLEN